MANTVYEIVEIQLSDGQEIQVRPLTIKNLKKFTKVIEKLDNEDVKTEEDALDVFIEAGMVCMGQFSPDLSTDKEKFEDVIEVPTLMKILEVAGGLKLNNDDPNLAATGLVGIN
jgi:hypothetical protein